MQEGQLAFANEPLVQVEGSLAECQLVETAILNIINFQTLIATKAARIKSVIGEDPLLEFGQEELKKWMQQFGEQELRLLAALMRHQMFGRLKSLA